jgi:glycosyltransferase involved in cell wall biosynthesis
MKIAFDLRRMANPGIGRYMRCLVEAVLRSDCDNEYLLLLPPDNPEFGSSFGNVTRLIPRSRYYSIREQVELPRILREQKVDLLHSPHFLLPLSRPCPAVVTIHDVIYIACPQDLPSPFGRLYYSAMMRASARLTNLIITDSFFSRREIVKYLHVDASKVLVIYPAVDPRLAPIWDANDPEQVRAKYSIAGDYVFYTGIYKPRKNHQGLMRAFKHFMQSGGKAQLVISGPIGEGERELRALASALNIASKVVFTGFIDDHELCALYSGAAVYACPSLYEGFGFTVLEAMACGVPVVSSHSASLPEVAGDAALYADAQSPVDFGDALYRAFTDETLRSELRARAKQNLRRFSWDLAAESSLRCYEDVTRISKRPAAIAA